MGRRFSSHGLLMSRVCGFLADSPPSASSSSLLQCASALRDGVSADVSTSFGAQQAAVYLPASTSGFLDSLRPRLASTNYRSSAAHPKMLCVRKAALRKLRTSTRFNGQVGIHRQPSGFLPHLICPRQRSLQKTAVEKFALHRQLCQLTASTSRARLMQANILLGNPALKPAPTGTGRIRLPKIGRSTIAQRAWRPAEAVRKHRPRSRRQSI
jgi:hypothetical protein